MIREDYSWKSDMATQLQRFAAEKKMAGFKYMIQERELQRFDEFLYFNGYSGTRLTKSTVDAFIYNELEQASTHYKKEILIKDFAEFLNNNGYPAYIPVVKSAPTKRCSHIPFIFTCEQLKALFTAIDSYPIEKTNNRNVLDPVLFRLLYGSGLRISEALNLKLKNVDTDKGILTILHAKNNKDRLVPIADTLNERIMELIRTYHRFNGGEAYLFPSMTGNKTDHSAAYTRFRDYLLMADIPHSDAGPRVHDLRHSFAVSCLKKWVLSGEEISAHMPYLAAYMGHTDFRASQYYLRLTAELYPDIISRTEAEFGYVIPEGGAFFERG
jgi:integrase